MAQSSLMRSTSHWMCLAWSSSRPEPWRTSTSDIQALLDFCHGSQSPKMESIQPTISKAECLHLTTAKCFGQHCHSATSGSKNIRTSCLSWGKDLIRYTGKGWSKTPGGSSSMKLQARSEQSPTSQTSPNLPKATPTQTTMIITLTTPTKVSSSLGSSHCWLRINSRRKR